MKGLRDEYNLLEKISVWFGQRSVVVYTMGKVGTLTICNSLRNSGFKHVHPHSLRYTRPGIHFLNINLSFFKKIKYTAWTVLKRIKVAMWKLLKSEIVIITGVRDPYSRNISAFFEQAHYIGGINTNLSYEELKKIYDDVCDFTAPLYWFDEEILKVTGVNVYDYVFNKERGFTVINEGKYRIFIYRLDKLNGMRDELASFLNEKNFDIDSTNFSEETQYSGLMKLLKNNYRYDKSISEQYVNSKYMKHFFTEDEVRSFENKWSLEPA